MSTGPVRIFTTLYVLSFRGLAFLLSCSILFLTAPGDCSSLSDVLESWSPQPNDLGVFLALGAQSAGGGISRLSTCFSRSWRGDGSLSSSMYIICSSGTFSWQIPRTTSWSFPFFPSGGEKARAGNFSMVGRWAFWEGKGNNFSPSSLRLISSGIDSGSDRSSVAGPVLQCPSAHGFPPAAPVFYPGSRLLPHHRASGMRRAMLDFGGLLQ